MNINNARLRTMQGLLRIILAQIEPLLDHPLYTNVYDFVYKYKYLWVRSNATCPSTNV